MPVLTRKAKHADDDEYKSSLKSYYHIAHSNSESITEQPSIMRHGNLKPYQVRCTRQIYINISKHL